MSYLDELKDGIKAKPKYQLAFFSVIATIIGVATFGDFGNGKMAISAILGSPAGVALAVMPFIIFSLGALYSLGKVIKENNKKNNKKNYDKEIAMKEYLRKEISEDQKKIEQLKNKLDQLIDKNTDKLKTKAEIDTANAELVQSKQDYEAVRKKLDDYKPANKSDKDEEKKLEKNFRMN